MISFKKVDKFSFGYLLIKFIVGIAHNFLYYKKIYVLNRENVPENEAVILAPNHQNALMDALAVLFSLRGKLVFVARADMFKKDFVAKILRFFGIVPIFRIRDGRESLKNNQKTFDVSSQVLLRKNKFTILPEGNHFGERRLRSLKKGFARIAFQAAESSNFKTNVKIIPTGLEYENYFHARKNLIVNFGKPIQLADYYASYRENPQKTIADLTKELKKRMLKLMIHIENRKYYETYETICSLFRCQTAKSRKATDVFQADKKIIQRLDNYLENNPTQADVIDEKAKTVRNAARKYDLPLFLFTHGESSFFKRMLAFFGYVAGFSFASVGFFLNFIPYFTPKLLVRNVEDKQFHSSVKFVLGILFFAIYYISFALVLLCVSGKFLLGLAVVACSMICGFFSRFYFEELSLFLKQIKFSWLKRKKNPQITKSLQAIRALESLLEVS